LSIFFIWTKEVVESRGRRKDAIQLSTVENENDNDDNDEGWKKIEKQSSHETIDHLSNLGNLF